MFGRFSWVFPCFFRGFSVAFFRGPHFGQILRVLALEKFSDQCFEPVIHRMAGNVFTEFVFPVEFLTKAFSQ